MSARLLTTRQRLLYAAHTAISLALHLWGRRERKLCKGTRNA